MSKNRYYVVKVGRKPGIYTAWAGPGGAQVQVDGFPGARYKGFRTLAEAESWLGDEPSTGPAPPPEAPPSAGPSTSGQPRGSSSESNDRVEIYTDGGCIGNPGPGGYGVVLFYRGRRRELAGGFRLTTNNRMELTACIVGLQALKSAARVKLFSDSQYVVKGMSEGWAARWRANSWRRSRGARAENPDLWAQLLDLCSHHDVDFVWVRGHAGNLENERCDELAMEAAAQRNLPPDPGYPVH